MWQGLFAATNAVALGGWIVLAFLPRRPLPGAIVLYAAVGLLCAAYAAMFVALLAGPQPAFDYSVAGLRALFAADGAIVLGWTHYLAFDLFVGSWIARDADNKGLARIWQLPFLFATFMAGPIGLLAWLIFREPRARAMARRSRT